MTVRPDWLMFAVTAAEVAVALASSELMLV
jgi:hypothetical protein